MKLVLVATGVLAGVLLTVGVAVFGDHSTTDARAAVGAPQQLVVRITGQSTDRVIGENLVVQAGMPVRLTIVNTSPMAHTFSVPELGIERVVLPSTDGIPTTTIVKFTPRRGVFTWLCQLPCGGMAGHMKGDIFALDHPPNVHGSPWAVTA